MAQAHLTAHGHGSHVGSGGQRAELHSHDALQPLPGGLPPSAGARLPPDGAIMHNIGIACFAATSRAGSRIQMVP